MSLRLLSSALRRFTESPFLLLAVSPFRHFGLVPVRHYVKKNLIFVEKHTMSPVTPTAAINPAPTVTADNHVSREERQQQLPLDKIVRATVAEGGQNKVMLELNQQRLQAETRLPLKTGQRLNLLVAATTPRIELQIIGDSLQQRLTSSLHMLGGKWDLQSLTQLLKAEGTPIINALSPQSREILLSWATMQKHDIQSQDGAGLRQLIKNLGLGHEANLARVKSGQMEGALKSALLETLSLEKAGIEMQEQAGRPLQLIELFQLCQIKLARQDVLFLPLPLPFLDQGFIIADHQQEQQADEKNAPPFHLSLHLSLQNLGDLRIDLVREPQGLFIRFICDSQEKADFVATCKDELMHDIKSVPLHDIAFIAGVDSPVDALIARLIPQGDSLLDTMV